MTCPLSEAQAQLKTAREYAEMTGQDLDKAIAERDAALERVKELEIDINLCSGSCGRGVDRPSIYKRDMEAKITALQSRLDAAMKVLFYCGSTLSARTPDALGKDIVIAEWQKRAHHCWERITALDADDAGGKDLSNKTQGDKK